MRTGRLSTGPLPGSFGSTGGAEAVFPVVHTLYDYDKDLKEK